MNDVLDLSEVTVSESGIDNSKVKKGSTAAKALTKGFYNVNNKLSDLAQLEADSDNELVEIKDKIFELTNKLKTRQKDLRKTKKAIAERRLVLLGERASYIKQIQALGGKIQRLDVTKLIKK